MKTIDHITRQLMSIAFKRRSLIRQNFKYLCSYYKFSELHTLEYIGTNSYPNVTGIASHLGMTRGAISKVIKKLLRNKHIRSFRIPDNKKEIYYELTDAGYEIFTKHTKIHQEFTKLDATFFKQFDAAAVEKFSQILDGYSDYLEMNTGNYDISETANNL